MEHIHYLHHSSKIHCLYHFLSEVVTASQDLRDREHNFQLPLFKIKLFGLLLFPEMFQFY